MAGGRGQQNPRVRAQLLGQFSLSTGRLLTVPLRRTLGMSMFYSLAALLRYNSHKVHFTDLNYTVYSFSIFMEFVTIAPHQL